jgi:branched-chain amino acid transport system ATP-binding protein
VNGPLLTIEHLSVGYGRLEVVHAVSLTLAAGEIATVIGPNGAGKTTLLAAIMGLLPGRGRIVYAGCDLAHLTTEDRVERGLVLVPEQRELFGTLSVADNLILGAYTRHYRRSERQRRLDAVYAEFPPLAERRGQAAATLSGGERQMLALGRALMAEPRLLLLDEPSLGLAPRVAREIFRIINGLRERGVSILLIEQNARAALECADVGYVLELGEIGARGPASALLHDPRVMATYLGGA